MLDILYYIGDTCFPLFTDKVYFGCFVYLHHVVVCIGFSHYVIYLGTTSCYNCLSASSGSDCLLGLTDFESVYYKLPLARVS